MSENCGVHDGVGNWGSLRNVEANAGEHLRPSVIGRRMKADCILGGLGKWTGTFECPCTETFIWTSLEEC